MLGTVVFRWASDSIIVKVKPGSPKGPLVEVFPDGELTISVRERAVDGKANDAVVRLLSAHFELPKNRMELVSGATSRLKRYRIGRGALRALRTALRSSAGTSVVTIPRLYHRLSHLTSCGP